MSTFPAPLDVVPFALLGATLGLDMVSFPQAMWSRQLVSATVAGALAGNAAAGLLVGAVLELIALETLPFGASRYAEWGTAGVVGGAVYAGFPAAGMTPGALPVAVFCALATAVVSSRSMVIVRTLNGSATRRARTALDGGDVGVVRALQLRGLGLDLVRGFVVTLVALVLLAPLAREIVGEWEGTLITSRAVVTMLAATIAAGAVWTTFHSTERAGWLFLLGIVAGGTMLVLQ